MSHVELLGMSTARLSRPVVRDTLVRWDLSPSGASPTEAARKAVTVPRVATSGRSNLTDQELGLTEFNMHTERKEDMSPRGFLRLIKEDDGDIIVAVGEGDPDGTVGYVASVQFCTCGSGGGGSPRTREALIQLMGAIAADNLTPHHRGGEHLCESEQKVIVQWAADCGKAATLWK